MHQQLIILYVSLCVLSDVKAFECIYCLFKGLISVQGCNCADTPFTLISSDALLLNELHKPA